MSSTPRGAKPGSGTAKSRPAQKSTTAPRLNRAQIQAMEIRSAATVVEQDSGGTGEAFIEAGPAPTVRRATAARQARRPVARPVLLTRAQEFAYVRADLKRLALTAGALFALMVVVLFIVER